MFSPLSQEGMKFKNVEQKVKRKWQFQTEKRYLQVCCSDNGSLATGFVTLNSLPNCSLPRSTPCSIRFNFMYKSLAIFIVLFFFPPLKLEFDLSWLSSLHVGKTRFLVPISLFLSKSSLS